jgi:hypothetical protein
MSYLGFLPTEFVLFGYFEMQIKLNLIFCNIFENAVLVFLLTLSQFFICHTNPVLFTVSSEYFFMMAAFKHVWMCADLFTPSAVLMNVC